MSVPVLLAVALSGVARNASRPPAAAPSRYAALVDEAKRRVATIGAPELKALLDAGAPGVQVIDVREDEEWAAGRVPGAVHLSKGLLEAKIEKTAPDPATRLILYCASGSRSALAADSLRKMGYTRVLSLDGGMRAWLAAGGPTVKK